MNASCVAFENVSLVCPGSFAGWRRDSVTALSPIVRTPSGPMKRNAVLSPAPSAKFTFSDNVNAGCVAVFG